MNIPKRIPLGNVTITQLKEVSGVPTTPVTFTSKVDMVIKTNENLSLVQLNKLKDLVNAPLTITENKGKRSRKQIYSLKHK
ncbi:MAG: hypothetical protein GWN01_15780, partial [Nitrosopumilaceae archaeon]|nr:hypothetical protein [Nitrosopumilaceae archaeon]NIU88754.1 hypothetical protein [Nitrosopumilaceae archaeon]NIX62903.1 hypothetical protein [Nitrosopumilaceae archaeon]